MFSKKTRMKYIKYILSGIVVLLSITGCSGESSDDAASFSAQNEISVETMQRKRTEYLAYEHRVTIGLAENEIEGVFEEIVSFCADDTKHKCTLLHSSLNDGDYSSGNIQLRIMPDGVEPLFKLVSRQGEITNKSTDVEDLQDAILNGEKRLEMLQQYRSRLLELEKKPDSSIESMIKIAEELSQVQSDIEYAEGEKAKLRLRIQMDVVYISLQAHSYTSFWGPISHSLSGFGRNLSEGISQVIIAVAYLLPWFILLVLLIYVLRIIWRRIRK
jgi:hypothetical protein